MAKAQTLIRSGLALTTNAEGRLKGWNDESVRFDGVESAIVNPPRERTSTQEFTRFGLINSADVSNEDEDGSCDPEPMAKIIRRRRSTSLTFIRDLLGF